MRPDPHRRGTLLATVARARRRDAMDLDLIVKGGTVVTGTDSYRAGVGDRGGLGHSGTGQEPGESLFTTLEKWDCKAAGKAVIDYSFHVVLTDLSRNALDEIKD